MNDKKISYTPEQEASIKYRGGSLLVSAAAGSGKTRVLVERLLSHMDEGANIDEFLIITYTRAAAFELRERIYEQLLTRLSESPGNMRLRRQAMLCRGASIDTIHTFCGEILRENAHIVGLPPDFRVADESESGMIMNEVIETLLEKVYEHIEDYAGFKTLLDTIIEGRDDKRLIEIMLDVHKKLQSTPNPHEWIMQQVEKLKLTKTTDISETDCGAYMLRKLRSTVGYCHEEMRKLRHEMKQYPEFENKYAGSIDETNIQIEAFLVALGSGWDEARRFSKVEFPRPKPIKGYEELKEIRARCSKILKTCAGELEISSEESMHDMRLLSPAITTLLQLVLEFDSMYCDEKRRRGVADFSDLEHLTLSLLLDKDTGKKTELARSLSKRYKEIMVDEYQDVNAVQEYIFSAVSHEDSNIFMVGDVKQSIYRFRLADPLIFLSKYKRFSEYDSLHNKNSSGTKIHLSQNFRSRPEILEGVNLIFKNIMSVEFGEMEYGEKERLKSGREKETKQANWAKQGNPYRVDLDIPPVELDVLDMSELIQDEQEENPEAIKPEAEYIAKKIENIVNKAHMIDDGKGNKRAAKYSDIAILLRSVKTRAGYYAAALSERGIPTDLPGSEGFFETVEISTALSILSVVDNPIQDIPLASLLSGPVYGFTDDELAEIRVGNNRENYYEALWRTAEDKISSPEMRLKCKKVLDDISTWRSVVADMSADRFIWFIYNKTGLTGLVSGMKGGEKRRNNLILLAESARRFEKSGYKGLFGFLTYIRNLQDRGLELSENIDTNSADSESTNAVKIMSIHKSKGLEFPIVILANTSKKYNFQDLRKDVVFHKDLGVGTVMTDKVRRIKYSTLARAAIQSKLKEEILSEEVRVLYVAMTRAKEKLIITATLKDAESKIAKLSMIPMGKIAPVVVASMSSMAEWIITAARSNLGEIKTEIITLRQPEIDDEKAKINYGKNEIACEQEDGEEEKRTVVSPDFDFNYPYSRAPDLPSKLTVTNLKTDFDSEAERARWIYEEQKEMRLHAPKSFIKEGKKISAAERGTLLHYIMQHIDYEKSSGEAEIRKELQRLVETEMITSEDVAEIDITKLEKFFSSDFGVRMIQAQKLEREFKFSILRSAKNYFSEGGDDEILLQGIIDCFFEEAGELVIVDFKTDKVTKETIDEKVRRYTPQLDAYADALERITGKRVKERVIYFFSIGLAYFIQNPSKEH